MEHQHILGHDHSQDEADFGHWPSPPDGLTADEQGQHDRLMHSLSIMVGKALYHRRTSGHFCTFRPIISIRRGHIESSGGIDCEGVAWAETIADLALRVLNGHRVPPSAQRMIAALTTEGIDPLKVRELEDGRAVVVFTDLSAAIIDLSMEWIVLMRDGQRTTAHPHADQAQAEQPIPSAPDSTQGDDDGPFFRADDPADAHPPVH